MPDLEIIRRTKTTSVWKDTALVLIAVFLMLLGFCAFLLGFRFD